MGEGVAGMMDPMVERIPPVAEKMIFRTAMVGMGKGWEAVGGALSSMAWAEDGGGGRAGYARVLRGWEDTQSR